MTKAAGKDLQQGQGDVGEGHSRKGGCSSLQCDAEFFEDLQLCRLNRIGATDCRKPVFITVRLDSSLMPAQNSGQVLRGLLF